MIDYYSTAKGNSAQLGVCRGFFRFVGYTNHNKLAIGIVSDLQLYVNKLIYSLSRAGDFAEFELELSIDGNHTILRGFQKYSGYRILGSGFAAEWDEKEKTLVSLMFFDIYQVPFVQISLPPPKLEPLLTSIKEKGYTGLTYKEPIIQGVRICQNRLTYGVKVVSEQSPFHGYQALVDVFTGEVVFLMGLSALGVYRVWGEPC